MEQLRPFRGLRLLAPLLAVGGGIGICLFILLGRKSALQDWRILIMITIGIGAFAWSMVVGVCLWRGSAAAVTWARVLFALQIPIFTVHGLSYEYFTGIAAMLLHGPGGTNLSFRLGASLSMEFDPGSQRFIVGANLIAAAALVLLFVWTRPNNRFERLRASSSASQRVGR
jgi:hypothetical protein